MSVSAVNFARFDQQGKCLVVFFALQNKAAVLLQLEFGA
jgi:hypothetical protein